MVASSWSGVRKLARTMRAVCAYLVLGLGFRILVLGLGFRVLDLGFWVLG